MGNTLSSSPGGSRKGASGAAQHAGEPAGPGKAQPDCITIGEGFGSQLTLVALPNGMLVVPPGADLRANTLCARTWHKHQLSPAEEGEATGKPYADQGSIPIMMQTGAISTAPGVAGSNSAAEVAVTWNVDLRGTATTVKPPAALAKAGGSQQCLASPVFHLPIQQQEAAAGPSGGSLVQPSHSAWRLMWIVQRGNPTSSAAAGIVSSGNSSNSNSSSSSIDCPSDTDSTSPAADHPAALSGTSSAHAAAATTGAAPAGVVLCLVPEERQQPQQQQPHVGLDGHNNGGGDGTSTGPTAATNSAAVWLKGWSVQVQGWTGSSSGVNQAADSKQGSEDAAGTLTAQYYGEGTSAKQAATKITSTDDASAPGSAGLALPPHATSLLYLSMPQLHGLVSSANSYTRTRLCLALSDTAALAKPAALAVSNVETIKAVGVGINGMVLSSAAAAPAGKLQSNEHAAVVNGSHSATDVINSHAAPTSQQLTNGHGTAGVTPPSAQSQPPVVGGGGAAAAAQDTSTKVSNSAQSNEADNTVGMGAQPSTAAEQTNGGVFAALCASLPATSNASPQVMLACLSPRILVVDNFLEPDVCEALKALADPRMVRSRVSTGTETPSRTSRGTFFTGESANHPLVQMVDKRMDDLMTHPAVQAGKRPLTKIESLQVVKYKIGDFYTEHYDNRAGGQVTRSATIIIYLHTCSEGGGTYFPKATGIPTAAEVPASSTPEQVAALSQSLHANAHVPRPGVRITAVQGRAMIFWSALPDGTEDLTSLHAAEAVVRGEKWIATRWYKELPKE